MIYDQFDRNPGLRILFTFAVVFILIHGLRFTQPVLIPIATAGFLAAICLPVVLWLSRKRVPLAIAVLVTVLAVAGGFALLIVVGSQQFVELQIRLFTLFNATLPQLEQWFAQLEEWVPILDEGELSTFVGNLPVAAFLTNLVTGATTWVLSGRVISCVCADAGATVRIAPASSRADALRSQCLRAVIFRSANSLIVLSLSVPYRSSQRHRLGEPPRSG